MSTSSVVPLAEPASLHAPVQYAELDWIMQDGVDIPVSRQFGDVYFSKANGLAETRHVFLQGNDLADRLIRLRPHQYFCVGETGFGTGLNILALWQLWQQCRPDNHSRLHVITVEKFPLSPNDLQRALAAWPELTELSRQLIVQYPPALPGCHRLVFAHERFSIDLWLGDAADCLPQIHSNHAVDAWFMDGFAPKCNPELWQDSILKQLIRLSGPGTTFASFSVAGVVKQGLRQFGIKVTRPAGFGRKREMLKAWWPEQENNNTLPPPAPKTIASEPVKVQSSLHSPTVPASSRPLPRIAIIGAGIAGLSMAHALASRGYACSLYDQAAPLAGASGNPCALIAPKLVSVAKFSGNLLNLGCLFSLRYWQQFNQVIEKTGILHVLDKRAEQELEKAGSYHQDALEGLSSAETARHLPVEFPSIWFKQAGLLNPPALARVILQNPAICFQQAEISQIQAIEKASATSINTQWQLVNSQQDTIGLYDHVLICSALHSPQLCNRLPALKPVRGQVSWFNKPRELSNLPSPITYGGYMAQIHQSGSEDKVLLGASFIRQDAQADIRLADHQHNLDLLQVIAPALAKQLPAVGTWQGRAAIRAQSPDYLPLVGQIAGQNGLWTLTGLGSKGFSFAPLCAELLCAQLLGEVWPVSEHVAAGIDPNRFSKNKSH